MNPLRDYLIRFAEPGSHDFHILCNKPECKHEDTNCNAYMDIALGYYNGHLYGVQDNNQEFTLIQMDMDATNHREIVDLPKQFEPNGTSHLGGGYFFDNGFLIYVAAAGRPGLCAAGLQDPAGNRSDHPAVSGGYPASHRVAIGGCFCQQRVPLLSPAPGKHRKAHLCRRQPGNRAYRAGI